MQRTDGSVQTDTRVYFNYAYDNAVDPDRILNRVVIASPGGNDTAIVFDDIPRHEQGDLSKLIQENYPGVEQVMYAEIEDGRVYGQMAGGEFCGNATRSLAFILSQDGLIEKEESAELYVSGASDPLNVMIDEKNALAQMPVNSDSVETQEILPGATIVDMEGISFLVLEKESEFHKTLNDKNGVEQKKAYVRKLLNIYGLDDKPASGVLALTRDDTRISMEPYVYVRDTGTLYYETACGSGTTAVGMLEAANAGKSIQNLEIYQPSGKPISVTIEYDGKNYKSAAINGPVDIVFDGNMPLNNKADITPINDNILRNEI